MVVSITFACIFVRYNSRCKSTHQKANASSSFHGLSKNTFANMFLGIDLLSCLNVKPFTLGGSKVQILPKGLAGQLCNVRSIIIIQNIQLIGLSVFVIAITVNKLKHRDFFLVYAFHSLIRGWIY